MLLHRRLVAAPYCHHSSKRSAAVSPKLLHCSASCCFGPAQRLTGRYGQPVRAVATAVTEAPPAQDGLAADFAEVQTEGAPSAFPWFEHWYPVGPVYEYEAKRPYGFHLLGMELVLWRDEQGRWSCLQDRCPHRLAPLSEGRVEADGSLQCSYHGWQFDSAGACTRIPQLAQDSKAHATACSSRKSCARAFPVKVVHDLVWVMPDSSPDGWARAEANPLPANAVKEFLLEGEEAKRYRQCTKWFARDVPLRFDTSVENVLDPSHAPFAHHGVLGNRNREKGTITPLQTKVSSDGFLAYADWRGPFNSNLYWSPPTRVQYEGSRSLVLYVVPTKPGWSRIFSVSYADKEVKSAMKLPALAVAIFNMIESTTWLEHISQRHKILDGDTYLLHLQERALLQSGGDLRKSCYTPAPADASVLAFRTWQAQFGGETPTCGAADVMPPPITKVQALDRYHQHTVNCPHCRTALRNTELASTAAAAAGTLCLMWSLAKAAAGQQLLQAGGLWPLLGAAVCGLLFAALRRLRQEFIYVDYDHTTKH